MEAKLLAATDPTAVAVFKVNNQTTASVNASGEVTIRQMRKAPRPGEIVQYEPGHVVPMQILEDVEVVVKLAGVDFAHVGRMVAAHLEGAK